MKAIGVESELISLQVDLQPGDNELCVTSLGGAEAPSEIKGLDSLDHRKLSFHIRGLEIA